MTTTNNSRYFSKTLITAAVASMLLAACASAPRQPDGAAQARSKLSQLQADPDLSTRAPVAMKEADVATTLAEQPQKDTALAAHRVYLADRKIDIARAQAETRFAEDQRTALTAQSEKARLDARTREADLAKNQAADARAESAEQKLAAERARSEADAARGAALGAAEQAAELQRQIAELQAKVTERGIVLTLGDVLFATNRSDLKSGTTGNLDKLVAFLNRYPNRTVLIEGYTDSTGTDEYNQELSQRRADAVRSYLVGQGISPTRLAASGKGENSPVSDNESATGRQQNRRVEVIISEPQVATR